MGNRLLHYHIQWSTYGSWLPGDPRGFRTRHHRTHIEGNYRHPPPSGEYDEILERSRRLMKKAPVAIAASLRETVGTACLDQLQKEKVATFVLSIGGQHCHVALVAPYEGLRQMIGRVKKVSSHAVRQDLPGQVWSVGCHPVIVETRVHWEHVLKYVLDHAMEGAWVWGRSDVLKALGRI
jgi:hypothetical protein